jgi:(p)ppGpp synthase/HD superfamily hydrolase
MRRLDVRRRLMNKALIVAAISGADIGCVASVGGQDPDRVTAALLHAAIEDQEVPRDVMAGAFGEDVAKLVEE